MARPRRSEATRQKLLEEGYAAFVEQGYHGTGLKDVLDRVSVPKGSFYNYFQSKDEFGAEIVRYYAGLFRERLEQDLKGAEKNAKSALKRLFRSLIRQFEENSCGRGCLIANLGCELEEAGPTRDAVAEAVRSWREPFRQAIAHGQEQGTIRDDLSTSDLADFLFNCWEGAIVRMKIEGDSKSLKLFTRLFLDEFLSA